MRLVKAIVSKSREVVKGNLACRERGEVKEVFVNVVNEKEELVSKVHGS